MIDFQVQGRNGYYAIDKYKNHQCLRHVESFKTRKLANSVASELNRLAEQINALEEEVQSLHEDAAGANI